ncbi:hypothetical protein HPB50_023063 [Hyalomma asiaticum]|uniref:Uncharacterized protein n=1 Tax=Hyalomma asiaticum TaxID=266040 RepID=A0ACB7TM62_HYAAI|nr:hypothetical protein HPB50_023063 [Hyalomma asiaticum]
MLQRLRVSASPARRRGYAALGVEPCRCPHRPGPETQECGAVTSGEASLRKRLGRSSVCHSCIRVVGSQELLEVPREESARFASSRV